MDDNNINEQAMDYVHRRRAEEAAEEPETFEIKTTRKPKSSMRTQVLAGVALLGLGTLAVLAWKKQNKDVSNDKQYVGSENLTPIEAAKEVTPTVKVVVNPTEAVAIISELPAKDEEEPFFEYDDETPTYDWSLLPEYDPENFVIGPNGKTYTSQEDIDNLFSENSISEEEEQKTNCR